MKFSVTLIIFIFMKNREDLFLGPRRCMFPEGKLTFTVMIRV